MDKRLRGNIKRLHKISFNTSFFFNDKLTQIAVAKINGTIANF
jgi:hypothetical protein